jgi:hypothetical protein
MKGSSMGLDFCVLGTIYNVFDGDAAKIDCLWTSFLLTFMMTTNVFLIKM